MPPLCSDTVAGPGIRDSVVRCNLNGQFEIWSWHITSRRVIAHDEMYVSSCILFCFVFCLVCLYPLVPTGWVGTRYWIFSFEIHGSARLGSAVFDAGSARLGLQLRTFKRVQNNPVVWHCAHQNQETGMTTHRQKQGAGSILSGLAWLGLF